MILQPNPGGPWRSRCNQTSKRLKRTPESKDLGFFVKGTDKKVVDKLKKSEYSLVHGNTRLL